MKNGVIIIVILAIFGVGSYFALSKTGNTPSLRQAFATDDIKFNYNEGYSFALALNQVLLKSFIPPCGEKFDFCVYYSGDMYKGTNLDSAGVAVNQRYNFSGSETCINTPPEGHTNKPNGVFEGDNYSVSSFGPISESGGGYFIKGEVYRVYVGETCYEIKTRISESDFSVNQTDAKREFTKTDRDLMMKEMQDMIRKTTILKTGENIVFPGL